MKSEALFARHRLGFDSSARVSAVSTVRLRVGWWLCGALSLLGCSASAGPPASSAPPPEPCKPVNISIALSASEQVNPDPAGQGRPVQVRIYQLKGDTRLRAASFEDVWQSDKTALAEDLIQVDQQAVYPGENKLYPVKPAPGMQYLAVIALFREPQGKDWFVSYQVEPTRTKPPCPAKDSRIPVWLDRMQIQDGAGRETGASP